MSSTGCNKTCTTVDDLQVVHHTEGGHHCQLKACSRPTRRLTNPTIQASFKFSSSDQGTKHVSYQWKNDEEHHGSVNDPEYQLQSYNAQTKFVLEDYDTLLPIEATQTMGTSAVESQSDNEELRKRI